MTDVKGATPTTTTTAIQTTGAAMRSFILRRESGLLMVLVVTLILFAITAPNFATFENAANILRQAAFVGIIALGMTIVIVAGEIDISVGSLVALSSAVIGVAVGQHGWPDYLAMLAVLVVGVLSGAIIGATRAYLGVPSFMTSLALFLAWRGLAQYITDGSPIPVNGPTFDLLDETIFGVSMPVVIFVLLIAIFAFLTTKTVLGRQIFAVGGNPSTARLAGVPIVRVRIFIFVCTGFLAALVGILQTARVGSGSGAIGAGLEFNAIAAVIIGGAAITGGRGTIMGTVLGVVFVAVLTNALVLYGVDTFMQSVVQGLVVFIAVILNAVQARDHRNPK